MTAPANQIVSETQIKTGLTELGLAGKAVGVHSSLAPSVTLRAGLKLLFARC